MKHPVSPSEMTRNGWRRVDRRPWTKLDARWLHVSGWNLAHCGHPTALHPWILRNPSGEMVLTGAKYARPVNRKFGTCWPNLREAIEYVATKEGPR